MKQIAAAVYFVGCNNGKKESAVNEFSIYFVKDLSKTEAMSKKLDDLPLEIIQ